MVTTKGMPARAKLLNKARQTAAQKASVHAAEQKVVTAPATTPVQKALPTLAESIAIAAKIVPVSFKSERDVGAVLLRDHALETCIEKKAVIHHSVNGFIVMAPADYVGPVSAPPLSVPTTWSIWICATLPAARRRGVFSCLLTEFLASKPECSDVIVRADMIMHPELCEWIKTHAPLPNMLGTTLSATIAREILMKPKSCDDA